MSELSGCQVFVCLLTLRSAEEEEERSVLHRLFYQGRWLELVNPNPEQSPQHTVTAFGFDILERTRASYDAFERGRLMFDGIYEPQDLAGDIAGTGVPFSRVADRDLGLCNSFRVPRGSRGSRKARSL